MKAGWQIKALGDVADFQRGLTYSKNDEVDLSDNIVLRASNIDLSTHLLDFEDMRYISDNVRVPRTKKVKKGSLLICTASGSKSHLGKVAYIDDDYGYAFGGFMGMLTPNSDLFPKYFFYLMVSDSYKDFIGALADGMNINNLKFDELKLFLVPYPPLPEQQRLVVLLDQAFDSIAAAKASAEQNLKNARALFDSHLEAVFSQRGEGWVVRKLGDVCKTGSGGTPLKSRKEYYDGGTIPWLMSGEVSQGNVYSTTKFITQLGLQNSSARLFPKDTVLVAMYGATAGQVGILRFEATTNQAVCGIFPNKHFIPEFLFYLMVSRKSELIALATGNAQPNISQIKIINTSVPVPSLPIQQRIVEQLDALASETQRLEAIYRRKCAALEELKQALLFRAFAGEL